MDPKRERELKFMQSQLAVDYAKRRDAPDQTLTNEIVQWLAAEVIRRGVLDHNEAAQSIHENPRYRDLRLRRRIILLAEERDSRDGSIRKVFRFSPHVLHAFGELAGKTVRWGKDDRYWVAVRPKKKRRA
jgi:hypothetical protein